MTVLGRRDVRLLAEQHSRVGGHHGGQAGEGDLGRWMTLVEG